MFVNMLTINKYIVKLSTLNVYDHIQIDFKTNNQSIFLTFEKIIKIYFCYGVYMIEWT